VGDRPNGELANYSQRLTYQGGAVSPDATAGYGPEEYALKQAKPGKNVVQAQFYGTSSRCCPPAPPS
jgi:Ca-activated chloride channel homolog